jgi:[ribosomal protein S18]-alanine N-acetyltransferase
LLVISPPGEFNIRRMSAADLDRVVEIAGSLRHAPHWPLASYAAAITPEHSPRRIALVAVETDCAAVAGFLVASLLPPEAELETFGVAESLQRHGIGGRLLSALVRELDVARVSTLNLEVRASNGSARGFYQAAGFTQAGVRPRYYTDPVEDAVLLRLNLK